MPLGSSPFDFDNRYMYGVGQAVHADGTIHELTDTNAVWLLDTKTMKFVEKVFHDPEYDFSNPRQGSGTGYIIKDQLTETILGLSYYTSKREYIYFDQAYANLRTSVESTFPGMQISMNANDDFSKVIINTSSPTNPNTTYFYNVSKGSIEFIDQYAPWLSEYALGTTEPFKFVTRDGLKMNGYISLPPGYKKGKKIPFIVHPHGGPNARDRIGYSPEIQVYTTRGYGVIQVNYRGSVGFGLKQMKLANKKWSLTMHDDLLDGLFWARDEGYVDMSKVCISGASYGGYSAMVGITKNPDYHDVCTGNTEHAEAVRVKFDSDAISYEDLLVLFFDIHDPTTLNRQGPDIGTQYRSEIFCLDKDQYLIADAFKRNLNIDKFNGSIITSISMAGTFWIAEEYHQKYIRKKKNMIL